MPNMTDAQESNIIRGLDANRRHFVRPGSPRGLAFQNGEVRWDPPIDIKTNVTHYNFYVPNEKTLVRQIPSSQTKISGLVGSMLFMSAFNVTSGLESAKVRLVGPFLQDGRGVNLSQFGLGPNGSIVFTDFTWTVTGAPTATLSWTAGHVTYLGVTYNVVAGSTGLQFVYWKLSNPGAFSATAIPFPALGVDDFVVYENGVVGNFSNMALQLVRSDGARLVLIGDSIFLLASNGKLLADLGGGTKGQLDIRDSTGTQRVVLDGGSGDVTIRDATGTQQIGCLLTGGQRIVLGQGSAIIGATQVEIIPTTSSTATGGGGAALPAQVLGFFQFKVGGTLVKVPFFSN